MVEHTLVEEGLHVVAEANTLLDRFEEPPMTVAEHN